MGDGPGRKGCGESVGSGERREEIMGENEDRMAEWNLIDACSVWMVRSVYGTVGSVMKYCSMLVMCSMGVGMIWYKTYKIR